MSERVRGYSPWKPQSSTRLVLDHVNQVLHEYDAHLPLTNRQLFYRLVGNYQYPKTENAYANLCEYLNRGRRAGLIPWEAIRDDGATESVTYYTSANPGDWLAHQMPRPADYALNPQADQHVFHELWCEAAGMVPMLSRMVADRGIPVRSSGGFSSVTVLRSAALRMTWRDVPTRVLHVGDYDASGVSIFEAAAADVLAFGGTAEFVRVALTADQIDYYDLPSAPPKKNDKRAAFDDDRTVQLESLVPDDLAGIVNAAIDLEWDDEAARLTQERQRDAQDQIADLLAGIGGDR